MIRVFTIAQLVIKEIFRKKDFYVALVLTGVLLFFAQSLQFYDVKNISRYLMEIGLALVFFFSVILTAALAARQFPSEIQSRTGPLLLAKPITRAQFVLGKWFGSFLAGAAAFTIFYVIFLGVVWAKAGGLSASLAAQTYFLFLLNLLVLSAMTSAFSYSLTVGANVSVTLVLYVLINTYGATLRESAAGFSAPVRLFCDALYFIWPHFEFFDLRQRFVHDWPALSPALLGILSLYAMVYTAAFLSWGIAALKKRSL